MKITAAAYRLSPVGGVETLALAARRPIVCARVRRMERLIEVEPRGSSNAGARDIAAPLRRIVERLDVWRQLRNASDSVNPFAEVVRDDAALYQECVERHRHRCPARAPEDR